MKLNIGAIVGKFLPTGNRPRPPSSLETPLLNPERFPEPQPQPRNVAPKTAGYKINRLKGDERIAAKLVLFFDEALPRFDRVRLNLSCKDISREEAVAWYDRMLRHWLWQTVKKSLIKMVLFLLLATSIIAMAITTKLYYNCFFRTYIPISMDLACPAVHMFHVEVEQPVGSSPWNDICVRSPVYGRPQPIPCAKFEQMLKSVDQGMCYAQTVTYRNKKMYSNPKNTAYVDVQRTYFYHCDNLNAQKVTFKTRLFPNQNIQTRNRYQAPVRTTNAMDLFANDAEKPPRVNNKQQKQQHESRNKTKTEFSRTDDAETTLTKKNAADRAHTENNETAQRLPQRTNGTVYQFEVLHTRTWPVTTDDDHAGLQRVSGSFQYAVYNDGSPAPTTAQQGRFENTQNGKNDELVVHAFTFVVIPVVTPGFDYYTGHSGRVMGLFECIVAYNGSQKLEDNPKMAEEIFTRSQSYLRNFGQRNVFKTGQINKTNSDNATLASATLRAIVEPEEPKNLAPTVKETNLQSETTSKMQHIRQKSELDENNVTLVSNSSSLNETTSSTPKASGEPKGSSKKNLETAVEAATTSKIAQIPMTNELEVQIPSPKLNRAIRSLGPAKVEKMKRWAEIESEGDGDGLERRVVEQDYREKSKFYSQHFENILKQMVKLREELMKERLKKSSALRFTSVPDFFVGIRSSVDGNSTES